MINSRWPQIFTHASPVHAQLRYEEQAGVMCASSSGTAAQVRCTGSTRHACERKCKHPIDNMWLYRLESCSGGVVGPPDIDYHK